MGLDVSAPAPVHAMTAGLDVRPVLPEHYPLIAASVREAYQHEYEEGRFNEEFDLADYVTWLRNPKYDPTLWQVAWDGDRIAGQVLSRIDNRSAEVFEVSVCSAWRRRGLSHALHKLRARGIDVIRLRTVSEFRTRAKDLYHSVGFRILKEFPRYRKPFPVTDSHGS